MSRTGSLVHSVAAPILLFVSFVHISHALIGLHLKRADAVDFVKNAYRLREELDAVETPSTVHVDDSYTEGKFTNIDDATVAVTWKLTAQSADSVAPAAKATPTTAVVPMENESPYELLTVMDDRNSAHNQTKCMQCATELALTEGGCDMSSSHMSLACASCSDVVAHYCADITAWSGNSTDIDCSPLPSLQGSIQGARYCLRHANESCVEENLLEDLTVGFADDSVPTHAACQSRCTVDPHCLYYTFGWEATFGLLADEGRVHCSTFSACGARRTYQFGGPDIYKRVRPTTGWGSG